MKTEFFVIGEPPQWQGQILEQLIAEEIHSQGEITSPHIVYMRLEGQWWRTSADSPQLYWQVWDKQPEVVSVPEEALEYKLRDLATEFSLTGQRLQNHSYFFQDYCPCLSLNFENGTQLAFSGNDLAWDKVKLAFWQRNE